MRKLILAAALAAAVVPAVALAQAFPSKQVRIIVPFPPGGYTDVSARVIAQALTEKLGQAFIVENRPGAGTAIGAEAVAKSPPDGYSLLYSGASTFTVNSVLLKNLPYDPVKSFAPLGIVTKTPMVVLVHPSFPAKSVKELVAQVAANPGKLPYGSFGAGTISHFAGRAPRRFRSRSASSRHLAKWVRRSARRSTSTRCSRRSSRARCSLPASTEARCTNTTSAPKRSTCRSPRTWPRS